MPVQRKVFRIEQMNFSGALTRNKVGSQDKEVLAELKALHELLEGRTGHAPVPTVAKTPPHDDNATHDALNRAREEIAAMYAAAFDGPPPIRMIRELAAVAESAERATGLILDAAEHIDDAANSLSASLRREQEQALALDIQDHTLRIFEACNFQDLSGQRIAKVLATLRAVEERFTRMAEICGSIQAARAGEATDDVSSSPTALHGPKLKDDGGHASQDYIDAMFAAG